MTIEYRQIPVVEGPLWQLEGIREKLLADVGNRTFAEIRSEQQESLLGEALYLERLRLRKLSGFKISNVFIRQRIKKDRMLLGQVQRELLKQKGVGDRANLLHGVIKHYADEIGGNFNPSVYKFATHAIPYGFSWLLNAASVKRFLPWGMSESLASRLQIFGEVEHLRALSKKGTILLVPTHQSNIDSMLIGYVIYLMGLTPFSYGAGLNLFSNPVLSFFMSRLGAYTVDRQKSSTIYKGVLKNYSTEILKQGIHSVFFPGGGRSRSGAIETHLKLGLLGTALTAQIENLRAGKEKPNIYVVPMTTSFSFVLEASSLIEDYLAQTGKQHFMAGDSNEVLPVLKFIDFFWKLFSRQTNISVRIGKPLDVFGNFVDENGIAQGPNGTSISPKQWLTTRGQIQIDRQRDQEYTRELGLKLVERYHRETVILSSHLVAWVFFQTLREQYRDLDLYRFLRLSPSQRVVPNEKFMDRATHWIDRLRKEADRGRLYLSDTLRIQGVEQWVSSGMQHLGTFHEKNVVMREQGYFTTEDMNLLYYYRNRLTGYGFGWLSGEETEVEWSRLEDEKGFLV